MNNQKDYYLLFPGRHHVLTKAQEKYLSNLFTKDLSSVLDFENKPLGINGSIKALIWAVTSANHVGTKRNPLPYNRREAMITDFSHDLPIDSLVYHIDDVGQIDDFHSYIGKKIASETNMELFLTPANTIVLSSTPEIAQGYMKLGFKVLPLERNQEKNTWDQLTPWQLLEHIVALSIKGNDLHTDALLQENVHPATIRLFNKYNFRDKIKTIQQDKILFPDGDLTETRDYNTYGRSFDVGGKRKYDLIKEDIPPGIIVDIGCCTGSLLEQISKEQKHHESDLYGIDIVPKFIQICETNKLIGKFENQNTFFMQKNAIDTQIFPNNFVDCFISTALTHEVVSYDGFEKLDLFVENIFKQLKPGGRRINVDVIAPQNYNETVLAHINTGDGIDYNEQKAEELLRKAQENYSANKEGLTSYLTSLSTYGKFLFFTKTFRGKQQDYHIDYTVLGKGKIQIRMQDIAEFMSKKDYTDNRLSEMNERFCFWSWKEWETYLQKKGFTVASEPIFNNWIYDNSYKGAIELYSLQGEKIPYPETNIKQIITKPIHS